MASEKGWSLDPILVDKWAELENGLRAVLNAMHNEYPGSVHEGILLAHYPTPSGYRKPPWRSREKAA